MQHSPVASLSHDGGRRRNGWWWLSCVPSSWQLEGLQGLPQQYEGWVCGRSARTARLRAVLSGGSPPEAERRGCELRCDADCGTDARAEGTGVGVARGCFHTTMRQHRRIDNDVKFTELNTSLPLLPEGPAHIYIKNIKKSELNNSPLQIF